MKEGNILSFRVFIDSKGFLMTEYTSLPEDKVSKVFKGNDVSIIQKVVTVKALDLYYTERQGS